MSAPAATPVFTISYDEDDESEGMTHGEQLVYKLLQLASVRGYYLGKRIWKPNQRSVYGGELVAQALMAAYETVPENVSAHSLHTYFAKRSLNDMDVQYHVKDIASGSTFYLRQVNALQHNVLRMSLCVSFKREEPNTISLTRDLEGRILPNDIGISLDSLPVPDDLMTLDEILTEELSNASVSQSVKTTVTDALAWCHEFPCEVKPCDPLGYTKQIVTPEASYYVWMRVRQCPMDVSERKRHGCLAYMSDMGILRPLFLKYIQFRTGMLTSLDHCIWFHEGSMSHFSPSQWTLFEFTCDKAAGSLTYNRGRAFSKEGVHLASFAQEGLFRPELKPEVKRSQEKPHRSKL